MARALLRYRATEGYIGRLTRALSQGRALRGVFLAQSRDLPGWGARGEDLRGHAEGANFMVAGEPEALGMSSERLGRLTAALQTGVDKADIPGVVLVVGRRGKHAYFEALGFRDREARALMGRDAIFRIASMTKPLTSLAAMMLVEEGKLALTQPVAEFLPAFSNLKVGVETGDGSLTLVAPRRQATVLDLLRHTAGFTSGLLGSSAVKQRYASSGVGSPALTRADFLAKLASLPLQFQPGAGWGYGLSTEVLGHLVEEISGIDLGQFVRTRITGPLGMRDTGFWVEETSWPRLAEPQIDPATGQRPPARDVFNRPARFNGASAMVSTAEDYARFCQFWLNQGELDGTRLVSRKTVELMIADHLPPDAAFDPDNVANFGATLPSPLFGSGFGLGFAIRTQIGRCAWHGSVGDLSWAGSVGTYFWVDPKEQLYAVFLSQAPTQFVRYAILARALVYQALVD
jgi:CubicO group peptidase (beta-lactamase class C family)